MKKVIFLVTTIGILTTVSLVIAKDNPEGQPFQALWDAISYLQEQIVDLEDRVGIIEESLVGEDYAFCQTCDDSAPTPYTCTRQEAAEKCESLGMHLCSLAELNAYAEATGHKVCCWGWTSDPDLKTWSRTKGMTAYFMGSSVETGITQGCGGDPGGLRIGVQDHLGKNAAHCCK
jgi:hypothetical protein